MNSFNLENPVFAAYAIAAALMLLKIMGQGWMTVYRMMKSSAGLVSPEDLQVGPFNKNPRPEQLDINDYVDRSLPGSCTQLTMPRSEAMKFVQPFIASVA